MDTNTIDYVAARLAAICRSTTIGFALEVGELIINGFYGGDLTAWRTRGRKDASFRALAARPDLPLSASVLYRCVATYEICSRMTGVSSWKHLCASHVRAVFGLGHDQQASLLNRAEDERWPVARLEAQAAALRGHDSPRGGRPRRSAVIHRIVAVQRALVSLRRLLGPDAFRAPGSPGPDDVRRAVAELRRECELLEERLAALTEVPAVAALSERSVSLATRSERRSAV